jgi:hypothetical protein
VQQWRDGDGSVGRAARRNADAGLGLACGGRRHRSAV